MKKAFFSLLSIGVIGALALTGCKKEVTLTPQQQIVGKWTMQSAIGYYVVMGDARRDTTVFTSSDYFQFNADGTLAIHEGANTPTGKWKIENNKLLITETNYMDYPNGFDISNLTSSELQLHYQQQDQVSTLEQKLNLAK